MSQTALIFINSYIKLPSQEQWRKGEKTSQPSFITVKRTTYWRMLNIKCFEVSSFPILHHPIFNIRYQRVGEKKKLLESTASKPPYVMTLKVNALAHHIETHEKTEASFLEQKSLSEPLNSHCFQTNTWMVHNWILACFSASLRVS